MQEAKEKQTKHREVGVAAMTPLGPPPRVTPTAATRVSAAKGDVTSTVGPSATGLPDTLANFPITNFLQSVPDDVNALVASAQKTGCTYQIDTKPNPGYTDNGNGGKSQ